MTWQGFFSITGNVARVTALATLNILMFILNLIFTATKFLFFILVFMLSLGRLGMSTMDLGGKRR